MRQYDRSRGQRQLDDARGVKSQAVNAKGRDKTRPFFLLLRFAEVVDNLERVARCYRFDEMHEVDGGGVVGVV